MASTLATEPEKAGATPPLLRARPALLLSGFSIIYFTDVCLRASEKYFWFDEIYTVYQSRLSLRGLWGALQAGFDFNPPLLYLLTKLANSLFGDGLIATRLPEIVGFWTFSVCIFYFVNKRAGLLAGFSAMAVPMVTGAFYYGYDARPHGLVLGFCGLALLAWQRSLESRNQSFWQAGFSVALFCAFMTHCYAITIAVPFGIAELFRSAQVRRMEYCRWAALVVPVLLAAVTYIPLLHAYHATAQGTAWLEYSPIRWAQIASFYTFLLAPCILTVLLILALVIISLLILKQTNAAGRPPAHQRDTADAFRLEIVLAASFLLLPVFGLLLALTMHSPFYNRYFLSALTGFCIFVGFGVSPVRRVAWVPVVLAGAMALSLLSDVSLVLWHRAHARAEPLVEPSSGFSGNSSLQGPLENFQMLVPASRKGERIVVLWPLDFFYLMNYAPELRSHLYYVGGSEHDVFFRILERVKQYAPYPYHTVTASEFYASRADFMFFGLVSDPGQLHAMVRDTNLKSLKFSNGRFLAEVSLK